MRCLERNKKSLYYALFKEKSPILDSYGMRTGQIEIKYYDPVEIKANISRAVGNAENMDFGKNVDYTHTLVVDDINCPITETSVLWYKRKTTESYNFIVVGVAESLNQKTYAIKEVSVSES